MSSNPSMTFLPQEAEGMTPANARRRSAMRALGARMRNAVPFQIKPPTTEGAIDREYDRELAQEELESATASAAADV